jgi:type I restriction enzyme S subunit
MVSKTSLPTDWEFVKAIDHIDFIRGQEPGSKHYNTKGHGQRFIRIGNLSGKRKVAIFTDLSDLSACNKSDILMSFDGSPGIVRRGFEGIYSSGIRKIVLKNTRFDRNFTYYALQSNIVQDLIAIHADAGTTIKHAGKSIFLIRIPAPSISEQKKIAANLSSVDDAIQATQAVIDQTRRVKQGLLQQLLTHGIGHTRFKNTEIGKIPKEWDVVRLGEVFSHRKEPGISGLPVMSVTMNDGLVERHTLDRRVVSELLPEKHLRAHKGDLVYNMMRMWQGASGVAWDDCIVSPAYVLCKPSDLILPRFIAQFFKAPATIRKLHQHSQGITEDRLRLYFQNFAEIVIGLPPKIEQKQISDILESIDNEVISLKNELNSLQRIKKAMMEDLLTGRVRVKLDEMNTT